MKLLSAAERLELRVEIVADLLANSRELNDVSFSREPERARELLRRRTELSAQYRALIAE